MKGPLIDRARTVQFSCQAGHCSRFYPGIRHLLNVNNMCTPSSAVMIHESVPRDPGTSLYMYTVVKAGPRGNHGEKHTKKDHVQKEWCQSRLHMWSCWCLCRVPGCCVRIDQALPWDLLKRTHLISTTQVPVLLCVFSQPTSCADA